MRNDREDNCHRAFRKASYRQYILDRYRYLGKGNRNVCFSCVVLGVWRNYPSQTGVYMGYRPEKKKQISAWLAQIPFIEELVVPQ